jgi:hypothetical protein
VNLSCSAQWVRSAGNLCSVISASSAGKCVRILDQSLQNRVGDGCAFTGSECLVEFVDDRQETLVLTIEFGNVYAIPI